MTFAVDWALSNNYLSILDRRSHVILENVVFGRSGKIADCQGRLSMDSKSKLHQWRWTAFIINAWAFHLPHHDLAVNIFIYIC